MPSLSQLAEFLDTTLDIASIPDYPNALSGVQLANVGNITHVATAVDFSSYTVHRSIELGAQLLLVHHGMFWGGLQALTVIRHHRLRDLVNHDVAVYAAHLPLDVHLEFGNNTLLAKRLGLTPNAGFARYQSVDVGVSGEADVRTAALVDGASV